MTQKTTLTGAIITETPKALLFSNGYKRAWLPKASVEIRETSERRTTPRDAIIVISSARANKEGFC